MVGFYKTLTNMMSTRGSLTKLHAHVGCSFKTAKNGGRQLHLIPLVHAPWLPWFPTHFIRCIYRFWGEGYEHQQASWVALSKGYVQASLEKRRLKPRPPSWSACGACSPVMARCRLKAARAWLEWKKDNCPFLGSPPFLREP